MKADLRINLSPESVEKVEEYAEKASLSIDEAIYELASIGLIMEKRAS